MNRTESLREHAMLARPEMRGGDEWEYLRLCAWRESSGTPARRTGYMQRYTLENALPVIDAGELIVGKPSFRALSEEERCEFEKLCKYVAPSMPSSPGQASHMAIDYKKLLGSGVSGIRAEIAELREKNAGDPQKLDFYDACDDALCGANAYAAKYSAYAAQLAEIEKNGQRASELREISRICARVPEYPAKTFYEALQSVHFVTFLLGGLYQAGRPDRYLIDYYRRDIENGILTKEQAQQLIDCFCVLFNEYIPSGLAVGFMVGGRDASGQDVSNELTTMFIKSISHTRMIYPGIGLCFNENTPPELLSLAVETLGCGHSHPALFNDEVIASGLRHYGLTAEEACEYIHSTCVEITPCSCSAVWVASPYTNLPQLLLDTLEEGRFADYDTLTDAYLSKLEAHIIQNAKNENDAQLVRYYGGGDPLCSAFVGDCLARGLDIDRGGAKYNWIMPSFVGLSNLADGLLAIKHLIYDSKEVAQEELLAALKADFAGYDGLLRQITEKVPKYGNDDDEVDETVGQISRYIVSCTEKLTSFRGDKFIPSLFCWVMHEHFGSRTGATPDGRRAGFPLGDGSGPAQGRERCGPTASILSSTKWEHDKFIGGIAVNLKFGKKAFDGAGGEKIAALIRTYMQRGGFELQINTIDAKTLEKARENPENHRDIVVRVGGYSDYFVRLSPAMQAEIILRTQHEI